MEKAIPHQEMNRSQGLSGEPWRKALQRLLSESGFPMPNRHSTRQYYHRKDFSPLQVVDEIEKGFETWLKQVREFLKLESIPEPGILDLKRYYFTYYSPVDVVREAILARKPCE